MKPFEEMDLPELYTALVSTDEKIAQDAEINFVDPSWQARREQIAAVIEARFPDVPVEPWATANGALGDRMMKPDHRPFGMVNPTIAQSPTRLYARVAYGAVLDYREISDDDIARERRDRASEGIELLPVDDRRTPEMPGGRDKVKIKPDRVVITRNAVKG